MAKIQIQIEDMGGDNIRVSVKSDCDFPADTSKWTTAQQAAMEVHHNLGMLLQDPETNELDQDHDAVCESFQLGPCNCPMQDVQ